MQRLQTAKCGLASSEEVEVMESKREVVLCKRDALRFVCLEKQASRQCASSQSDCSQDEKKTKPSAHSLFTSAWPSIMFSQYFLRSMDSDLHGVACKAATWDSDASRHHPYPECRKDGNTVSKEPC